MLRILVVDDDPLVSQAIELWLKQQGFEVVTADGAATGLAVLTKGRFDLMIVDIFMPTCTASSRCGCSIRARRRCR